MLLRVEILVTMIHGTPSIELNKYLNLSLDNLSRFQFS
jgi:uncharacterized ferritin-like protein (DUF455 family)